MKNWRFWEIIDAANQTCVFDVDTCSAVFDLAERLEIPFGRLLSVCETIVIDIESDPNYLPPRIEKLIDCDISSEEELREICDYYNCKYYDLDKFMVMAYRAQLNSK